MFIGVCTRFWTSSYRIYDLPHGMAVGMVLPHVIQYNKKAAEKEFAELAVACDPGKASEPEDVWRTSLKKAFLNCTIN